MRKSVAGRDIFYLSSISSAAQRCFIARLPTPAYCRKSKNARYLNIDTDCGRYRRPDYRARGGRRRSLANVLRCDVYLCVMHAFGTGRGPTFARWRCTYNVGTSCGGGDGRRRRLHRQYHIIIRRLLLITRPDRRWVCDHALDFGQNRNVSPPR